MNEKMEPLSPAVVVESFNRLGYSATFAAVAADLQYPPESLYRQYQSREALGEAWLSGEMPKNSDATTVHGVFLNFMHTVVDALDSRRDFSRDWMAAVKVAGVLHLPQLRDLHDAARGYFEVWLEAMHASISLPDGIQMEDVLGELADALCLISLGLLAVWETDRSKQSTVTYKMIDSTGYLLDGLLMRREDFGDAGLLVQLHRVLEYQHQQFLRPVLDIVLKPDRAQRLADPVNLVEVLRMLRPVPRPQE